jgi:hypothetical protein
MSMFQNVKIQTMIPYVTTMRTLDRGAKNGEYRYHFRVRRIFLPRMIRHDLNPKRWYPSTRQNGVLTQKIAKRVRSI